MLYLQLNYYTGETTMIFCCSEEAAERLWHQIDTSTHDIQAAYIVEYNTGSYETLRRLA